MLAMNLGTKFSASLENVYFSSETACNFLVESDRFWHFLVINSERLLFCSELLRASVYFS
jgi:hypothetical protein